MSVLRLIQFTDPHLYGSETESLRGVQTLAEIAEELGLTRERVRQIQSEALKRLRLLVGDATH